MDEVTLAVGETKRLPLPGGAHGGFRWTASVEAGEDVVEVATGFDEARGSAADPGPLADETVALTGRAPGRATVVLTQSRSWETTAIEERRLAVTVVDRAH